MKPLSHAPDCPSDRPWRTLFAMTGSLSMIMLDTTVVGVALPTIQSDLHLSTSMTGWMVTSFVLTLACLMAVGGRLGDRVGRLPIFRLAVLTFVVASIWCSMATSDWPMLGGRILQGAAAACMQPAATAIVIGAFPAGKRGMAMALFFGISLLFLVAGPVIGGVVIDSASWHWIFLLNIPVGTGSLLLTIGLNGPGRRAQPRPFDALGTVLLLLGLPTLVLGALWLAQPPDQLGDLARLLVLPGLLLTALFVRHCLRTDTPLLNLRHFHDRTLLGESLVLLCLNAITVGQSVYGMIYLQEVLRWTPLEAGFGALALLIPVLLVIGPAGRRYDRHGARPLLKLGLPIALVGLAVEVPALVMESFALLAVGMVLLGTGVTLATTPCNTDAMSRAPSDQRGEVSGLIQTMRMLGASFGVILCVAAISLSTEAAVNRNHAAFTMHADIAQRCLQGDLDATRTLEQTSPQLADSIRVARRDGMATAFALQWLLAAAATLIALKLVHTRPPGEEVTSD